MGKEAGEPIGRGGRRGRDDGPATVDAGDDTDAVFPDLPLVLLETVPCRDSGIESRASLLTFAIPFPPIRFRGPPRSDLELEELE